MLGFRTLLRTHDKPELLDVAFDEVRSWLISKNYDPSGMDKSGTTEAADGVELTVQRHTDDVGSPTLRVTVIERQPTGTWTSELTAHTSPDGVRGWLWLDIHKPDDHDWTATPRLARSLVKSIPVRDGKTVLNPRPTRVEEADVEKVLNALLDPARRGLAFVAGTSYNMRFGPWRDRVDELLHETVGLANAWVLTSDATNRFNYFMGRSHTVGAESVRTYLPGVRPHDALDGERHRFVTSTRIGPKPSRAIRRVLGHRAREQLIDSKLPDLLRDLDRILRHQSEETLLDELTAATPTTVRHQKRSQPELRGHRPPPAAPVVERVTARTTTEPPATSIPAVASIDELPLGTGLSGLLSDVLGIAEPTHDDIYRLKELVRTAQRADTVRLQLRKRLDDLHEMMERVEFERDLARDELRLEVLERASAEEERADAERRLRYLQNQLASSGRADVAWSDPEIDLRDIRPDSFVELVDRLNDLDYIVFTGQEDITLGLDKHGPARSWAGKCWDALLALDDYARISVTQSFQRDVNGYLEDPPAGCRTFSANRHAPRESDSVQQNPRFRTPRELPVPHHVDEQRKLFMGAHFKIAQSARVSPRIHYLDHTAGTQRVYVGYIGPHLPTPDT